MRHFGRSISYPLHVLPAAMPQVGQEALLHEFGILPL